MEVGLVGGVGAGDGDASDPHGRDPLELGHGFVHVGQGQASHADQALGILAAVVADPVVVPAEDGVRHLPVGEREGDHVDARVHDLAHDAVLLLLLEPGAGVEHPLVETLVSPPDELVGGGVVQAVPGDAEAAHGDGELPQGDGGALAPVVAQHLRRPAPEVLLQPLEHLGRLNHVGVARVVDGHAAPLLFPVRPCQLFYTRSGPGIPSEAAIEASSATTEGG